jgi:hypothetical protein
MPRSVAEKMGLKAGARTLFVNAPESALASIEPPNLDVSTTIDGEFGYIHLFVISQAEMEEQFPRLKAHLQPAGALWVSWPKGRQLGTDLALPEVIRIGYRHGLVESTTLRVDDTWSAIKFTHPKPGKQYHNSYGQLPDD